MTAPRDHGGGLDHAMASYGGARADWLDLSTGINPVPYPIGEIEAGDWTLLPDRAAHERLLDAARQFWNVPDDVAIVAMWRLRRLWRYEVLLGSKRPYIRVFEL